MINEIKDKIIELEAEISEIEHSNSSYIEGYANGLKMTLTFLKGLLEREKLCIR